MWGRRVFTTLRTVAPAVAATALTLIICLLGTFSAGVQLATSTLLVMGGNDNPAGLTPVMAQQLGGDPWYPAPNTDRFRPVGVYGNGYIDTVNNTASPYYGWDFTLIQWPAHIGLPIFGGQPYEPAQQQGVHNIDQAISAVLPSLTPGEAVTALGYSSSANVVTREMRVLQNQPGGAPATDQLQFFLMGNPNRPNGGIMQRFAGLYVPLFDIRLDGSTPVTTPYATTDVSWEYDTASDFPIYPINLLADLNSLIAGPLLHGNYYPAEMNGPRAFPDSTVGNITYITLAPPHLPLLMPLYTLGFPKPLLDLVEPALTVMVDWGYDRSISPGTPAGARLIPRINPITATIDLVNAVGEGVRNFCNDLTTAAPAQSAAPSPARTAVTSTAARGQTRAASTALPVRPVAAKPGARTGKPAAADAARLAHTSVPSAPSRRADKAAA